MNESTHDARRGLSRAARITGLLYLGLALSAVPGVLVIRPRLFSADDPSATLANLVHHEALARSAVGFELLIVVTQALTAVLFYRLFRRADPLAAASTAAFGLVNAVAILVSAAAHATALQVALDPFGDAAATVQLLYLLGGGIWEVAAVFFGLWLIPMGWCVLRSGGMPRALGWILIAGGVGYTLSAFARYLAPGDPLLTDLLVVPATVGELWIIGYLLIRGYRGPMHQDTAAATTPTPAAS